MRIMLADDQLRNQYVALYNFSDSRIVGKGDTPDVAYNEAKKKGVEEPVILYVPDKDEVFVY